MAFYADLHIHSKYSRATSKHCDLKHLAYWARKKGIDVIGTGDFTHPVWRAELQEQLVAAEPGLFRLRDDLEKEVASMVPAACRGKTRFMLSVEISTIYKKGDKTRKIHHLLYAPDFRAAERIVERLATIGNLHSDGRPILGLDSRHLLEITLESDPGAYLVPAHIWTPWFAALGSKSGFDAIDECYADLAPHIFAVETGLSSDPEMNWRVSALDRFRLVSNSDAHSPEKLGREACLFDTDLDYFSIRAALETGRGYVGTVEFFPEEGKYHLDGHRSCQLRLLPAETKRLGGKCPSCGKPLTVGVMHRVDDLADRGGDTEPGRPQTAGAVHSLVPLPEIVSEILDVGPKSKAVGRYYESLLGQLGPELPLINDIPLEDIQRGADPLVAEAVARLRNHEVIRKAGYDGVYGSIKLFRDGELRRHMRGGSIFDRPDRPEESDAAEPVSAGMPDSHAIQPNTSAPDDQPAESSAPTARPRPSGRPAAASTPPSAAVLTVRRERTEDDPLAGLDPDQRRAAEITSGPLLIVAGPGSGKTRTLTHRIAHLVRTRGVSTENCLAITFTRRAADEMRGRLQRLLPDVGATLPLFTFHGFALAVLQRHWNAAGLQRGFRLASDTERRQLLCEALGVSARRASSLLAAISIAKRTAAPPTDARRAEASAVYQRELETRNLVDFDDLIQRAIQALESDAVLREAYRARYRWLSIDEYQDVDAQQLRLVKLLVARDGNLCAIGDPDQAIYRFRGADVRLFHRFTEDFPDARIVRLTRNYRSESHIVAVSSQVIAPAGSGPPPSAVTTDTSRRITVHTAPTDKAEAEFVVHEIERLLGGHSFFSIDSGRSQAAQAPDVAFSDIAVLYRTDAQAPALVEALQRSGMPFQKRSHTRLLDHPGVTRLVDALRAESGDASLEERLDAVLRTIQTSVHVDEAVEFVRPIARMCGTRLEQFLSTLGLETQADTWDPRADRISVLTLHAAKGLEFPVVFIVGCEDGILPLRWGGRAAADLDEERRLFYVGVTRAKTRLFLCHATQRRRHGQLDRARPSPYLADIQEQLLERGRSRLPARRKNTAEQLGLF